MQRFQYNDSRILQLKLKFFVRCYAKLAKINPSRKEQNALKRVHCIPILKVGEMDMIPPNSATPTRLPSCRVVFSMADARPLLLTETDVTLTKVAAGIVKAVPNPIKSNGNTSKP